MAITAPTSAIDWNAGYRGLKPAMSHWIANSGYVCSVPRPMTRSCVKPRTWRRCLAAGRTQCRQPRHHLAMGILAVIDGTVHGSWKAIRDRTIAKAGAQAHWARKTGSKRTSIPAAWLSTHPRSDLRKTAYRMEGLSATDRSRLLGPGTSAGHPWCRNFNEHAARHRPAATMDHIRAPAALPCKRHWRADWTCGCFNSACRITALPSRPTAYSVKPA